MNQIIFTVGPDYTIAQQSAAGELVTISGWIGKTLEEFTAAMKRDADSTEEFTVSRGKVTNYIWNK